MDRRNLLFGALTLLLIGSIFLSFHNLAPQSIPKAHAVSHSIQLTGTFSSGWNGTNPGPTIRVVKGDIVSMTLISGDSAPHTFIIDVSKAGVIPGPNCSVDKCSPQFPPTASYQFTVDFSPGTYTYYCSIHLGAMVGSFIVSPPGPDYGILSNPSSLTILQGANANSTVSVTSFSNFAGSVTLSTSPSSPPGLLTSSFNVNPVSVPTGGTAKSNFTITVPASTTLGAYTIIVTAKNSTTFSHSTTVSVTVTAPDFTITASPTTLSVNQGSSSTLTVTVSSINGFSSSVTLSAQSSAGGPSVNVSPAVVQVSSGSSASATVTVTASSSGVYSTGVSAGGYTMTLNATAGSLFHTVMIPLTVTSPPSGAGFLTNPVVIGGIVLAIVIVAIAAYVMSRKSRK